MELEVTTDSASTVRHARFGKLPDRVRYEDMVEEKQATLSDAATNPYAGAAWNHFNCLAMDLGL
ncbi:hypothetical protein GA0115240_161219 [Streptomyces sp. DvalAA-14]|uniref:hypothetical protein n=1 Tax=unclassified Streptomyces TaxID=2593676 RepID=UPI00081B481A|nr:MULTISPECIES: hypothetical protein [unclassified Streptomyces]MYS24190.1 hypothetical protein [Streptomyces sp. SID4948]SCE43525.1 hypothetical protein GA0115240_161219 [Streptomyces sp. DvalAA-14]